MPSGTKKDARVGDLSEGFDCDIGLDCCPHEWSGPIITGATRSFCQGPKIARIGDFGDCCCPHGGIYKIISSSSRTHCEGKPIARVGDIVVCLKCGSMGKMIAGALRSYEDNK